MARTAPRPPPAAAMVLAIGTGGMGFREEILMVCEVGGIGGIAVLVDGAPAHMSSLGPVPAVGQGRCTGKSGGAFTFAASANLCSWPKN